MPKMKGTTTLKRMTFEAMSGDYDHMVQTCMSWVNVS